MFNKLCIVIVLGLGLFVSSIANASIIINGDLSPGEWDGASIYDIQTNGPGAIVGKAYLKADLNYVYGGFDITGWTSAMGADSHGNILGMGVTFNGKWVEIQQSTNISFGPHVQNGLYTRYRQEFSDAGFLPTGLEGFASFTTGANAHRVWEAKIPLAYLGATGGDTIYVAGGIDFDSKGHWYPAALTSNFVPANYAPFTLPASSNGVVPEPGSIVIFGTMGLIMLARRSRRNNQRFFRKVSG